MFAIRFSENGQWLLSASLDGSACVWDVKAKTMHAHYKYHAGMLWYTFRRLSIHRLFASTQDAVLTWIGWMTQPSRLVVLTRKSTSWELTVLYPLRRLCTLCRNLYLITEKSHFSIRDHENEINQLKFNPSRTRIASCSDDHTARVWELGILPDKDTATSTGQTELATGSLVLRGHTDSIGSMSWCPNLPADAHDILAT